MIIAIERRLEKISSDFLDTLGHTLAAMGHEIITPPIGTLPRHSDLNFIWNHRYGKSLGQSIICELGWLPRTAYQMSWAGINAESHIAPYVWNGAQPEPATRARVNAHRDELQRADDYSHAYMQTRLPTVTGLPGAYLLVPLQMNWDTNILDHAPPVFADLQGLIDYISWHDPDLPLVFKQHPADLRRGNLQLALKTCRPQDRIHAHADGNVHQLLKSAACRGVIALNSNVLHDALIWGKPGAALANNIWPRGGPGPFLHHVPRQVAELQRHWRDSEDCRIAYFAHVLDQQWSLEDAANPDKLGEFIDQARANGRLAHLDGGRRPPKPVARNYRVVNVVAANKGWLFEDLKYHACRVQRPGIRVIPSDHALGDADSWVFIRTHEAAESPDPGRSVVQIHDLFDDGRYRSDGARHVVERCGALVFTHPQQRTILSDNGIHHRHKPSLCRPIGALSSFKVRRTLAGKFTIGWVGRSARADGRDLKRIGWLPQIAAQLDPDHGDWRLRLIGEFKPDIVASLRDSAADVEIFERHRTPVQRYPGLYQGMDCLLITSSIEAGPMVLFEALASGIPVITTNVGWGPQLIINGENGFLVEDIPSMVAAIESIRKQRTGWFERRYAIAATMNGNRLEDWWEQCIDLAIGLADQASAACCQHRHTPRE